MTIREELGGLSQDEIEDIERLTLRWVFQAAMDFGFEAHDIFRQSPDEPKDIAEDITREILDRLSGFNIPVRVFGTVDYKKARYIILPNSTIRQALFVDSKAEKSSQSATLQMSQTSMCIHQSRGGRQIHKEGLLPPVYISQEKQYLTTSAFLHFKYGSSPN